MSRVKIDDLLEKIREQAGKGHYLNALWWCIELQMWLLGSYNDILKGRREDGNVVE